jgi:hypothetical protein
MAETIPGWNSSSLRVNSDRLNRSDTALVVHTASLCLDSTSFGTLLEAFYAGLKQYGRTCSKEHPRAPLWFERELAG